jgi:hypothetical protein
MNMSDWNHPRTVHEAVSRLMAELPLKYRVYIASLNREEMHLIFPALKSRIGQEYGLYSGNRELMQSCRNVSGLDRLAPDQCPIVIIEKLWKKLKKTHALRLVENKDG